MTNSQMNTEFRLVGREYDGASDVLARTFPRRMINIVIQEASKKYGSDNTLIPTDVHLMPVFMEGDSFFAVRAWHETASPKGSAGVLQPFIGTFEVVADEEHAYLHPRQDNEDNEDNKVYYRLTTAEALGLLSLSRIAASHDAIASYVDQETI